MYLGTLYIFIKFDVFCYYLTWKVITLHEHLGTIYVSPKFRPNRT
jgi:hypothetical protein